MLTKALSCAILFHWVTLHLVVCGSVHHSTIRKEKSNKMQQCIKIFIIPCLYEAQHVLSVPDNVHQLHVQQASTYEKPEAARAV